MIISVKETEDSKEPVLIDLTQLLNHEYIRGTLIIHLVDLVPDFSLKDPIFSLTASVKNEEKTEDCGICNSKLSGKSKKSW